MIKNLIKVYLSLLLLTNIILQGDEGSANAEGAAEGAAETPAETPAEGTGVKQEGAEVKQEAAPEYKDTLQEIND
jgi:hypothetical protein